MNIRKCFLMIGLLVAASVLIIPTQAKDQISYVSQPDEAYIFLNNVAFVRDQIALPGGVDVRVFLPPQIYLSTLVVRENGQRVPNYRIRQQDGQLTLEWASASSADARQASLEYLLAGLSWTPRYDMALGDDQAETVDFSFFAEIQNTAFNLDSVTTRLIAGRVDVSGQMDSLSGVTMNQYLAGYEESSVVTSGDVGAASIQYIYDIGALSAANGEMIYQSMVQAALPARRVILWNAQTDQQASLIYKVRNQSDLPFAEGTVHAYQNDIFIGSDLIEITPVGSEGSVTVGKLQNLRVNRSQSQESIDGTSFYTYQYRVTLTLTNFGEDAVTVEVVDYQQPAAEDLVFASEPQRETGNILRWIVTLQPNETTTIDYSFKTR